MQNLNSIEIEMVPVNKERHDINMFLSLAWKIFWKYLQIQSPNLNFSGPHFIKCCINKAIAGIKHYSIKQMSENSSESITDIIENIAKNPVWPQDSKTAILNLSNKQGIS